MLTFKTQTYRKNSDFVTPNDHIISESNGTISELRIFEGLPPKIIGEYGFSVWNVSLARILHININNLLAQYHTENIYNEFNQVLRDKLFNINNFDKIVFIQGLVIHPDYRKTGVSEEFIEMIYRDYYASNVAVIVLAQPIQNNAVYSDFYFNNKTVEIKNKISPMLVDTEEISALDYYCLNKLLERKDTEVNEYKLFRVAKKCGFNRIGETHLFLLSPAAMVERIMKKQEDSEKNVNDN